MKKVVLSVLAVAISVIAAMAQQTDGSSVQHGDLRYTFWGDFVSVRCVNPNAKDIVIPAVVTYQGHDYWVAEIGMNAFAGCEVLETVVIKSPGFQVLAGAFKNCYSLREIVLPNYKEGTPEIGCEAWPATLDDIFDNPQFSRVTLKVPSPANFKASAWKRFTKISAISANAGLGGTSGKPSWIQGWFYMFTNEYGHMLVYFGRSTNRCVHVIEGMIHKGSYEYINGQLYVKLEEDLNNGAYKIYEKERKLDPGYERGSFFKPANVDRLSLIIDPSTMRSIENYCQ